MRLLEIFQCRDIIIYPHIKFRWYWTMFNFCGIVVAILKMVISRNFQCQESIRDIMIYPHINFWWYRTMMNFCGIVAAILIMAIGRNFSMSNVKTSLSTHISNFDDIGQCWIFTTHFLCRVLAAILKILKMQNCSSNGDLSLCQILCLHHYPFRSYQH